LPFHSPLLLVRVLSAPRLQGGDGLGDRRFCNYGGGLIDLVAGGQFGGAPQCGVAKLTANSSQTSYDRRSEPFRTIHAPTYPSQYSPKLSFAS